MGSRSLMQTSAKSDPRLLTWASADPVHKSDFFYKLLLFNMKGLKIWEINIFMKIRFVTQLTLWPCSQQWFERHCTFLALPNIPTWVFSSVQFTMVSMHSVKSICTPLRPSELSPTLPFKRFQCLSDNGLLSSFQGRSSSASSFHASLLQAIDGVMSLVLCPQGVSQTSQHFRFSEKQATCEACMSRAVHPQEFFKVDAEVWSRSSSVFQHPVNE